MARERRDQAPAAPDVARQCQRFIRRMHGSLLARDPKPDPDDKYTLSWRAELDRTHGMPPAERLQALYDFVAFEHEAPKTADAAMDHALHGDPWERQTNDGSTHV